MRTKTFPKGTHPPEKKTSTENVPFERMPGPEKVSIPLHQHFGSPAEPLVNKGDEVSLGQKIGEASALFSASVHSSVSGKVISVDTVNHPLGKPVPAVTVQNDGEDRLSSELKGTKDPFSLNPNEIREKVKEAGIVGLGGAAFPTAVKLSPPKDKQIDTIILNGCECEPILTADYRLMLEFPEDIIMGAELIRLSTGAKRILFGIEDNKKSAHKLFAEKLKEIFGPNGKDSGNPLRESCLLKTKYPQGAEKNLIYALLGREVPRGGLPFDVGVVVQNVGTVKAVWDAVKTGTPLYERGLTVSGDVISSPKNLIVRIGTSFKDVLDYCGGLKDDAGILIMGGPMMGLAQWTADVPVIKGTSGILAWKEPDSALEFACISCGRCLHHCPMGLTPTQIMKYVQYDYLDDAEERGALDCVECGCCQYSCPAKIPLVHWIRLGKNKIISERRKTSA